MINRTILFLLAMLLACGLSAPLDAAIYSWTGAAGTSGWHQTLLMPGDPVRYVNNFGMIGNPPIFPSSADDVALGAANVETTLSECFDP